MSVHHSISSNNLSETPYLKKIDPLSFCSYKLSIAPQLAMGLLCGYFPLTCWVFAWHDLVQVLCMKSQSLISATALLSSTAYGLSGHSSAFLWWSLRHRRKGYNINVPFRCEDSIILWTLISCVSQWQLTSTT